MPELSLFHIRHEGKYITADAPLSPFPQKAEAAFKDWVVKAGGLLGQKTTWGVLHVEDFIGGGIRFGSSHYRIQNVGGENVARPDKHSWAILNTDVKLTKDTGKLKVPTSPYLNLGLRVGFPLKTLRTP
jgi:hypothetical protein